MSIEDTATTPATTPARPPQDLEMERVHAEAVARERGTAPESGETSGEGTVDRERLIELLNGDLSTEYQSIVQYVQHVATLKGAQFLGTIAELKTHLSQELHHALVLAEQVDFLGGTPSVTVPTVSAETDTVAALQLDLDLEERQLDRYRDRVRQANDAGLPDVAEALRPLLEQTQEHVRDLQAALGS
jgi:bacterioferritin